MTHTSTQQPEALNLEEFRVKVTRAAREPLLARITELEAQLGAAQQGMPLQSPQNLLAELERIAEKYAWSFQDAGTETYAEQVQAKTRKAKQSLTAELKAALATRPTQYELEQFIEKTGDVHFQRCRVGSREGEIRWYIEFGHYGAEVRGKTLQEALTKALAAQAKRCGGSAKAVPLYTRRTI